MFLTVGLCACMLPACRGQKAALDPIELGLQVVVSSQGAGNRLGSSVKTKMLLTIRSSLQPIFCLCTLASLNGMNNISLSFSSGPC